MQPNYSKKSSQKIGRYESFNVWFCMLPGIDVKFLFYVWLVKKEVFRSKIKPICFSLVFSYDPSSICKVKTRLFYFVDVKAKFCLPFVDIF